MEECLYTSKRYGDYERILPFVVFRGKNDLPHVDNDEMCKLVVLSKGRLVFDLNGKPMEFKAPAAIYLSERDKFNIKSVSGYQAYIILFKPDVINDAFSYERLYSREFDDLEGSTIYQDYLLIRNFIFNDIQSPKAASFVPSSLADIVNLTEKIAAELKLKHDGYWPCRSRSYFIELLYKLKYCYIGNASTGENNAGFVSRLYEYFNNHLNEKITLEMLTSEFGVNRNTLNKVCVEETGLTCLSFLNEHRMNLAKYWLSDTDIPVFEIAQRLSFDDPNYFNKVFRKATGKSPTQYREESRS
ncbi:MAG: helix-turn-helix transcriptional regulator [Clostridiales bacterium]|nr:helix-turn-helix transcriptional regulator [Clostridiales bacterium]